MQKLKSANRGKKGSTLVGAVALCAIIAIAIGGLLGISRNTTGQEADSFDDATAFLAAESGLLFGVNWIKHYSGELWGDGEGITFPRVIKHFTADGKFYPGADVKVQIEETGTDHAENIYRLTSTATMSNPELPYKKQLEWTVKIVTPDLDTLPSGHYGTFIDRANSVGFRNVIIDGPFHSNTPLWFSHDNSHTGNYTSNESNNIVFRGYATVYNSPPVNILHDNQSTATNTYLSGIEVETGKKPKDKPGVGDAEELDKIFTAGYNGDATRRNVNFDLNATDEIIYLRQAKSGESPGLAEAGTNDKGIPYRTFVGTAGNTNLQFGVTSGGNPNFTFGGGSPVSFERNRKIIFEAGGGHNEPGGGFDLNMMPSTMLGHVTVKTKPGHNITFDLTNGNFLYGTGSGSNRITPTPWDELTSVQKANSLAGDYDDSNKDNNYGIGMVRTDVYAFYAGGTDIVPSVSGGGSIKIKLSKNNERYITAQLFARDGSMEFVDKSDANPNTVCFVIGVSSLGNWHDGHDNSQSNSYRVLHDRRAVSAPGISYTGGGGGGGGNPDNTVMLIKTRWKETNF